MPSDPTPLARRVRALREARRLSVYALADAAGVPRQTVHNVEAGSNPTWETICRLADALGVSTDELRE